MLLHYQIRICISGHSKFDMDRNLFFCCKIAFTLNCWLLCLLGCLMYNIERATFAILNSPPPPMTEWRQWRRSSVFIVDFTGIYLFKVNNRNDRTKCEICWKLTIKTQELRQWRRSGVFILNFEHISHLVLVFLLFNSNM